MMEHYDHIVIGFGKGGKTLAGFLASKGQGVALIEKSDAMFGGTCINVACIPTKSLEYSARLSGMQGGDFDKKAQRYRAAIAEKRRLTALLREKNYQKAVSAGVEVIVGTASFLDAQRVEIRSSGETRVIAGDKIYINTGSRPFIPPIPGLAGSKYVCTSETLMELDSLPEQLVIIGGGYIGLEFASYYQHFGSQVTILQDGMDFIPREDAEVAKSVLDSFSSRGIQVLRGVQVRSVEDGTDFARLLIQQGETSLSLQAQAVLVATGRRPNLADLHPERAGVQRTERGAIYTDSRLRTSAPNIYALGDVTGGLQFTYISLDDSRIIKSQLFGDGSRTAENRGAVPYTVFLDPPLSRVGLTEAEAAANGRRILVKRLPATAIPKAQVLRQTTGILKIVLDAETDEILGAHLFAAESHELINLMKLAMDAKLPYSILRDAIYTHPTMSESLNDLLA